MAKIGHLQSELAVTFGRNNRSRSIGISGQNGPEYALSREGSLFADLLSKELLQGPNWSDILE